MRTIADVQIFIKPLSAATIHTKALKYSVYEQNTICVTIWEKIAFSLKIGKHLPTASNASEANKGGADGGRS